MSLKSTKQIKKKAVVKKPKTKKPVVKTSVKKTVNKTKVNVPAVKMPLAKKTVAKKSTAKPVKVKETTKVSKPSSPKRKMRYTSKELNHFRQILLDERKAILESAQANMKSLVDKDSGEYVGDNLTYASHMAEQGTDEMEREKNYLFVQRDEKYLGYIQDALIRIDLGIYGVCSECIDEPKYLCDTCPLIPKERLEVVPITQHCIECKKLRG